MGKLDMKALGLTLGIIWGAAMFLLGIINIFCDYGGAFIGILSTLYLGYTATFLGSIIGAIWGFVDAGIGGVVIALVYNKFVE